jgi:hypothetical protein
MEAQILEVQELGLRTRIFSSDRNSGAHRAPALFGSQEYLGIPKGRKAGAQAIVLLAKGFTPQAQSMIRKSGYRFSEKIMLKQKDRAR